MLTVSSESIDTSMISQLFKTEVRKEAAKMQVQRLKPVKMWDAIGLANEVLQIVSNATNVSVDDLKSKSRYQHIVEARHIYFNILMCYTDAQITKNEAAAVIDRDHATCIHSVRKCEELNEVDVRFAAKFKKCLDAYRMTFTDGNHFIMEYNNHPQL